MKGKIANVVYVQKTFNFGSFPFSIDSAWFRPVANDYSIIKSLFNFSMS